MAAETARGSESTAGLRDGKHFLEEAGEKGRPSAVSEVQTIKMRRDCNGRSVKGHVRHGQTPQGVLALAKAVCIHGLEDLLVPAGSGASFIDSRRDCRIRETWGRFFGQVRRQALRA